MKEVREVAEASIKQIADFFLTDGKGGKRVGSLTEFSAEWKTLDDASKDQIKKGIGDGTLTY
jgi:hypothetical protein